MTKGNTSNVTVVGEVGRSDLVPLTPKGERLLDAIALAGGVKQAVNKITLQISRQGLVKTMALDRVIQDPTQNIRLNPGDVITAFYQPFSFTALGASGKNDEINFEAPGISLTQALGRIGGVQDSRADVKGVFVFRFEEPDAIPLPPAQPIAPTAVALARLSPPVASSPPSNTQSMQPVAQQTAPSTQPQPFLSPRGVIPVCAACVQPAATPNVAAGSPVTTQITTAIAQGTQVNPQVQNTVASANTVPSSNPIVAPVPNNGPALVVKDGIPPTQFTDSQGRVPTVYRLDMGDPGAFLVAQGFMVKNKDVIYVANASSTEFAKFLGILVQVMYPLVNGKAIGL
jgi:hypothetical protein